MRLRSDVPAVAADRGDGFSAEDEGDAGGQVHAERQELPLDCLSDHRAHRVGHDAGTGHRVHPCQGAGRTPDRGRGTRPLLRPVRGAAQVAACGMARHS